MVKSSTVLQHPMTTAGEGTLVWIGPTRGTTVEQAFEYCVDHAAQVAVRKSLEHWLQTPAERVRWLVVVKPSRNPAPQALIKWMEQSQSVRSACLVGPECEGELRTGSPWPYFENIAWHRWNQTLPSWFQSDTRNPQDHSVHDIQNAVNSKRRLTIGIVATRRENIDALMDSLATRLHTPLWIPSIENPTVHNLDAFIWDDSAMSCATDHEWSTRLQLAQRIMRPEPNHARPRANWIEHVWMPSFPRPHEWENARRGGVGAMISKPFTSCALNDWLNAIDINQPTADVSISLA